VAALCQRLGIPHHTLVWGDWKGRGNLQAAARAARYALLSDWARSRGIPAIALGHTLDDQAETFLLRLARGSGVDGLAAMRPATEAEGLVLLRPLLRARRETLRAFLRGAGILWAEDPSNADLRFQRIRLRGLLDPLAATGITPERLAGTAGALGRARDALDRDTAEAALACLSPGPAGDLRLRPRPFAVLPWETRLRLLAGALCWVAGTAYRPRLDPLAALCDALTSGAPRPATLHGCLLVPAAGAVSILREPGHAAPPVPLARRRWDHRWETDAPAAEDGLQIAALGTAGLRARQRWRDSGLPRLALLTTPAVWRGTELVAAPILDPCGKWTFRRISSLPPPWAPPVLR
jgi:tRNA(Ile)-lysidine synthase